MSQRNSSATSAIPFMPVISALFASYSDAQGFWVNERSAPTTKNEEEVASNPLSLSLHVDTTRELRSAQYSRNKAKDEAKFARTQKSKRQGQLRRAHPAQRSKGTKRSGKRQPIFRDLAADSETNCEQDLSDSVFLKPREAVFAPVRANRDRPISTSISTGLQQPAERTPKGYTPPDAYTAATLPESVLDIPAPDVAREFRSYERYRHQTKKNARFTQSRKKKDIRVKPIRTRGSKPIKTENLRSLVTLAIIDEETASEDEIQTPIEVSLSVVLPNTEFPDVREPSPINMEALITTARVKYTKGSSESWPSNTTFSY